LWAWASTPTPWSCCRTEGAGPVPAPVLQGC
jgi:hypothetical protein